MSDVSTRGGEVMAEQGFLVQLLKVKERGRRRRTEEQGGEAAASWPKMGSILSEPLFRTVMD